MPNLSLLSFIDNVFGVLPKKSLERPSFLYWISYVPLKNLYTHTHIHTWVYFWILFCSIDLLDHLEFNTLLLYRRSWKQVASNLSTFLSITKTDLVLLGPLISILILESACQFLHNSQWDFAWDWVESLEQFGEKWSRASLNKGKNKIQILHLLVMSLRVGVWTSGQKKMWCVLKKKENN